jgi:Yip1 domain
MNLVERAKAILQKPKEEWPVIEAEQDSIGSLFWHYVVPLAAIPPVAAFIGAAMTGYVGLRIAPVPGLVRAVAAYVLTLVSVFIVAFVVNFLAGVFGGQKNFNNAMKVSIYAPTAFWLAGIFAIQPPLAFLSLMGLYSFYLLYTGLAALMKPPAAKVLTYTIVVVGCVIVLMGVIVGAGALTFGVQTLI